LPTPLRAALEHLGNVLANGAGLRGLFGVDYILKEDTPWPVEVNPRYTASVEMLEYGLGRVALALHRQAFDPAPSTETRPAGQSMLPNPQTGRLPFAGKAILFARAPLVFPSVGPWLNTLEQIPIRAARADFWDMPSFADIPPAGQRIEAGRPILSFFARAESVAACLDQLREMAADLDRLFGKT
jgi:predicted ATP-grasp superfamily ATP-dependent carboligase